MFERVRPLLLRLARVPSDPSPPSGAPGSVRVFRASANLYRLRLLGWAFGQAIAIGGIVFSFWFLIMLKREVRALQADRQTRPPTVAPVATGTVSPPPPANPKNERRAKRTDRVPTPIVNQLARYSFPILTVVECVGVILYLVQLVVSYAGVRLDYELRWYIVTDRSLRIRTGLLNVQEMTMSFANLQQVTVTQGPLQRVLRMADVCVQSAGGGGDSHARQPGLTNLHTGVFHGVDNATEVRDLILERLRQFRAAGLGDPEDARHPTLSRSALGPAAPAPRASDTVTAAQELLAEARALRHALAG